MNSTLGLKRKVVGNNARNNHRKRALNKIDNAYNFLDDDNHKEELYLFSCEIESLSRAIANMENLKILIIMNQPRVKSFEVVKHLVHLQELWIVECELKVIE